MVLEISHFPEKAYQKGERSYSTKEHGNNNNPFAEGGELCSYAEG